MRCGILLQPIVDFCAEDLFRGILHEVVLSVDLFCGSLHEVVLSIDLFCSILYEVDSDRKTVSATSSNGRFLSIPNRT